MSGAMRAFLEYESHPGAWAQGDWTCLMEVTLPSDPWLSALMANLYNDWDPPLPIIAFPRGLPPDVSSGTREAANMWRGHHESYLTYDELVRVQEVYSSLEDNVIDLAWIPRGTAGLVTSGELEAEVYRGAAIVEATNMGRFQSIPAPPRDDQRDLVLVASQHRRRLGPNIHLAAVLALLGVYHRRGTPVRMVFFFEAPDYSV